MTKTKQLLFALAAVAMMGTEASAANIGYTNGQCGRSYMFRRGTTTTQGMAIRLNKEKLQLLKGKTISSVDFATGSVQTTGKTVDVFITTDITGEAAVKESVTIVGANKWTTGTLSTPYTITGEEPELYIGFTAEIKNTYNLLTADYTNDLRGCCFVYNNGEWEDTYGLGVGAVNIRAVVDDAPSYVDAMVKPVGISGYFQGGKNYSLKAQVLNVGTQNITKAVLGVMTSGREGEEMTFDNLDIAPGQCLDVTLPFYSKEGNVNASVFVSLNEVNGSAVDADMTDNQTSNSVFFYPVDMERSLFVEMFTGQDCSQCPSGHRLVNNVLDTLSTPFVEVAHHVGYYPDSFTMSEEQNYLMFYGESGTFAPAITVNRTVVPSLGAAPVVEATKASTPVTQIAYVLDNVQPYVSLSLESEYDEASRKATVKFKALAHTEIPVAQTLFNVFLVQDSILAYQSNGGGSYPHTNVFRGTLTGNVWGLLTEFKPGEPVEWETTFVLPDTIRSSYWNGQESECTSGVPKYAPVLKDMKLVAFVGGYDAYDYTANQVFNAIEVKLGESHTQRAFTTAVQSVQHDGSRLFSIRQQGRTLVVDGDYDRSLIFDMQGRIVGTDVFPAAGLYIVKVSKGSDVQTHKIMVK